jgi:hypothetical protein
VEVCVQRISWDLVRFCVRRCGYGFGSTDLRFLSLTIVVILLCWLFGVLARQLPNSLLQQAQLQQVLPGSSDGRVGDVPSARSSARSLR